jgi:3-oxoadipate enol-lactonase
MPEFATATGSIDYEVLELEPEDAAARPITLLHNFMSTGRTAWSDTILETLHDRCRILLPDLPGHGRSHGYPLGFDYRRMAEQIAALMEAEGFSHGHLAGCSAGGMIAQLSLHHQLAQPATLTLISAAYSVNPATTGEPLTLDPQHFRAGRNWMEFTAKLHDEHQGAGYFDSVLLPGFRNLTPELGIDLPPETLEKWQLPVCLIHGEEDEIFPVEIAGEMARRLPQAELHIVPGQTHALIFRQPWKVAEIMVDFLNRHSGQMTG